jgi:hypothetical protein
MTPTDFRNLALDSPGAIESQHMNHPDFRVGGKIFATLSYPDESWGMVNLTPDQQRAFMKKAPDVFKPSSGAWGKRGATHVHLPSANKRMIRSAMNAAWKNVQRKR